MSLRLLLTASSFCFTAAAFADLTPRSLSELVRQEDRNSGGLLPFPAFGSSGQVDGLSVTYDRLTMLI